MLKDLPEWQARLRPWLILGRVSNLPTVWSNCLAAWLLGGGGPAWKLALVLIGATFIYVGGMFLNDACDAEFDRRHRRERPIPAGDVEPWDVWVSALCCLAAGWICLVPLGWAVTAIGFLLILSVVVYDMVHKAVAVAPVLMALCRYFLFLAAGAASADGIVGDAMWSALVLGAYVVGLSYVARRESLGGVFACWPLVLLLAPVILAGFTNAPSSWGRSAVIAPVLLFGFWTLRCLSHLWRRSGSDGARRAVSGLLAGIVLVDVMAVMPSPWPLGWVFAGLFGLSLLLQRTVPAT